MSLCPMECRGRKNQEIKGTSPDPLPPSGSQKGGGDGYERLPPIVGLEGQKSKGYVDHKLDKTRPEATNETSHVRI